MAYDETIPLSGTTTFGNLYQIIRDHVAALRAFFASGTAPAGHVLVIGNMWYDATNNVYKIYDSASWTDISEWSIEEENIKWNNFSGDATPDVSGMHRLYITGATAIADFDGADIYDGQKIIILAGSSFTVTHAANQLELAGDVDFDMDANDTLTIIYDETDSAGSRWVERKRSDNS